MQNESSKYTKPYTNSAMNHINHSLANLTEMMRVLGSKVSKVMPSLPSKITHETEEEFEPFNDIITAQCNELSNMHTFTDLLMCSVIVDNFTYDIPDEIESDASFICKSCTSFLSEKCSVIKVKSIVWYHKKENLDESTTKKQTKLFYNLKRSIKRHLKTTTHKQALQSEDERKKELEKITLRNESVGLKCARIIHHGIFEEQSYYAYERNISTQYRMQDIGSAHHSRNFAHDLIGTMSEILSSRLNSLIISSLPCIGNHLRPICIVGDKGTMKGLTLQPISIETILLLNGYFKTSFYAGTPLLKSWTGLGIAKNILVTLLENLGLSLDILPACINGGCFDGEYFIKNVQEHLAELLKLEGRQKENFELRCIWDPAHRLEKADEHARKKSPVVKKFYKQIHEEIKYFRVGKQHVMLKKEAESMQKQSYEPKQISETRFVAHEHQVLCNQFHNWPIQFKYWEDRSQEYAQEGYENPEQEFEDEKTLTNDEITISQKKSRNLRDVKYITSFLAMLEITDLLTRASCSLQSTSKFPWEFIEIVEDLLKKLEYITECFNEGVVPNKDHKCYNDIKYHPNGLHKQPWVIMKSHLPSNSKPTFQGIAVLCTVQVN